MPDDLADIMKIGPESHHLLIGQLRNHLFVKLGGEMDTIPDGDPDDGGHQQKVNGKLRDGKIQILFEMPDTVEIGYSKKRQCKNRKKQLKNGIGGEAHLPHGNNRVTGPKEIECRETYIAAYSKSNPQKPRANHRA